MNKDKMSKVALTFTALIFLVLSSSYADHFPVFEETDIYYLGGLSVVPDTGRLDPYFEVKGLFDRETFELDRFNMILGGYYRFHNNFKMGAFYQLESGALHDDDWLFLNPGWTWADTSERLEQSIVFDGTPRILLPGALQNIGVASLKIRFTHNFYNGQQKVLLKPGVSLFYLVD